VATRQRKNSKFSGILFPAICVLISAYFFHHGVHGRYGAVSLKDAEAKALHLNFRLAEYRKDKELLEHRVSLLKTGSIERDMLDEQARYHLNMLHQDDVAIFLD